jgi:hypothetical protein
MTTGSRVFNPRGDRGGGGLVVQITISEAEVQRWLGPIGAPSALSRMSVERGVDAAWKGARRDLLLALAARETDRARGAGGGDVSEAVGPRQPGASRAEEADASRREPGTGVSMATAGPIAQGSEGDPT